MNKTNSLIILLIALAAHICHAQLTWDNKQLDFHPTIDDTVVTANFNFSNIGKYPVTILSLKSSCGCTTAELDKKTYNPGEKGTVVATYKIGTQTGFQQKTVTIQTDDGTDSYEQLTIRAYIPELVSFTPGYVFWTVGEAKSPKTISIKVTNSTPINIINTNSTNETLFAKLKTIKGGSLYEINVTPSSTDAPAKATIIIESDFPKGKPKSFNVFAEVKGPVIPLSSSNAPAK